MEMVIWQLPIWDWNSDKWEDEAQIITKVSSEAMKLKEKKFSRDYRERIDVQGPSHGNFPRSKRSSV